MSKLKLAFIGLGRAAQHYAEVIKENLSDEYIFSVGVDQYAESRSKWEKENSGKTFASIDEVSKDDVDIAIITTPSGSHAENSKVLLQNGVNVLCESSKYKFSFNFRGKQSAATYPTHLMCDYKKK